ncbi:MAG: UbiX family flavin prenyltransferase [Endozoicomonas sp. (ex Botrylloides leachii)]|nr:UbiX family flavin prenyltransferase [Endozoicomonas sp. (ex Botrylloides leachii)]
MTDTITLAMTGASGAQYGLRLLQSLVVADKRIFFMVSKAAQVVLQTETLLPLTNNIEEIQHTLTAYTKAQPKQINVFGREDWMAPVASGSGASSKMVICPCSSGTLSSIAYGASNNLIERAADVALKERRQLILVSRECPLSEIHLENMLKLTRMGAVILPASPGFYNQPKSIDDLIDFVVARILSQLGIDQALMPDWGADRL